MYSVWFLFSKEDTRYLKNIMKPLRVKFDFPEFLPHMAVFEEAGNDLKKVRMAVQTSTKDIRSFKVKTKSICWSTDIWKTLYVNIEKNQILETIYQRLNHKFKELSTYNFQPHISLMYKRLSKKEKEKLSKTISVKREFFIQKIGIVNDSGEIEDWKLIEEILLG